MLETPREGPSMARVKLKDGLQINLKEAERELGWTEAVD